MRQCLYRGANIDVAHRFAGFAPDESDPQGLFDLAALPEGERVALREFQIASVRARRSVGHDRAEGDLSFGVARVPIVVPADQRQIGLDLRSPDFGQQFRQFRPFDIVGSLAFVDRRDARAREVEPRRVELRRAVGRLGAHGDQRFHLGDSTRRGRRGKSRRRVY